MSATHKAIIRVKPLWEILAMPMATVSHDGYGDIRIGGEYERFLGNITARKLCGKNVKAIVHEEEHMYLYEVRWSEDEVHWIPAECAEVVRVLTEWEKEPQGTVCSWKGQKAIFVGIREDGNLDVCLPGNTFAVKPTDVEKGY